MNFNKKMLYSVLMFAGLFANLAQASQVCDEQGRTVLMNFVIQKEQDIASAKAALKVLWDKLFYNQAFHNGYIYHSNGMMTPHYTYLPVRRISTTDADVVAYQEQERKLALLIATTVSTIETTVQLGVDINAQDLTGKTVLNYCHTQAIYDELLRMGADFQLKVWAYFNPGYATLATLATVWTAAGIGALCYNYLMIPARDEACRKAMHNPSRGYIKHDHRSTCQELERLQLENMADELFR